MRIILGLILGLALISTTVGAQVPRGVIAEDCTATWCVYCPYAYVGLEVMKSRYDTTEFTSVRYYATSGGLGTAETDGRIAYYSVSGFPTVLFDGPTAVVGGDAATANGSRYDPIVSREIGRPSPLKITINSLDLVQPDGSINFDIEVAESMADISNVKIRVLILENDVTYGTKTYTDVTRDILPVLNLTVSQLGQVQNVVQNFAVDPAWKTADLWAAIFVQDDDDKAILQSGSSRPKPEYSMRYWAKGSRIEIAPSYSVHEFQDFAVYNYGTNPDVIRLTLNNGTMPSGWICAFTDGVNDYTSFLDLNLNPGESRIFRLKVTAAMPGYVTPKIVLTSANLPGVERSIGYSLITDDLQVLLVDDDGADTYDSYHTDALQAYGATYGVWNTNLADVTSSALPNFPVVVWQTGLNYPTLAASDRAALGAYLDGGGKLFVTGQEIGWELNAEQGAAYAWYRTYLHATFKNDDSNVYNLTGVVGDPISDGMTLVIQGGDGANNQTYPDAIDPYGAGATTIFSYNNYTIGKAAIKADTGVYKVVYLGFGYEAISTQANRRLLMQRILQWFNLQPMDVSDPAASFDGATVNVYPNPAAEGSTLHLSLPSAGNARVDIYTLDGSLVRTLQSGTVPAGVVDLYWDGRNNGGESLPSGVYFYRLRGGSEDTNGKLILTH